MGPLPRLPAAVAAGLLASLPAVGAAQILPSIDARTWAPSADPNAGLALEPTQTPGPWQWNAGAWLSYAQSPVVLRNASSNGVAYRPLDHALGADLVAGIGLGDRALVGVDVPVLLYQDGTSGLPPTIVNGGQVPSSGLGDIAILGKGVIVRNDPHGVPLGFGLAALGAVTLPTGDRGSFASDGSTTASLRLLAEYALGAGALRASLGYSLRTAQQTWPDPSLGGVTFGDSLPWSIGATLRPKAIVPALDGDDRQSWEIALHGWLPVDPVAPFSGSAPQLSPALLAVSDRIALGHYKDAFVLVGGDFGLDQAVGVPIARAVLALGWAPRAHDRDGDGIPDDRDECPDLAEDKDGIQDEDGCPEDDADGDGILDTQDACPLVPGVWWNDPKKNGCPAPDTDGDGIPDPVDACPAVKGVPSDDPKKNGCPVEAQDRDRDGIPDDADKCPDQPEDKDGFEDFDGCPDPDDDGDGIPDSQDACPQQKGIPSTDPARNGCPNPDRDGDTYDDDVDKCPDEPEVFNGVKDDDGCPDEGGRPLATVDVVKGQVVLSTAQPIALTGSGDAPAIDPKSEMTVRAVAQQLNLRPDWTLAVGGRGGPAVAARIEALTHRPGAAVAVAADERATPAAPAAVLRIMVRTVSRPAAPLPEKKSEKGEKEKP